MFNALLPPWLIISALVPLTGLLIWFEMKRPYRFRTARIIAVIVMMVMLSAILLRPKYSVTKSTAVVLLTPGFDKVKTDSLLKMYPDLQLMHTTDLDPYNKSLTLSSFYELAEIGSNIRYVLGQGLPTYALDLVDNKNFDFIPGTPPAGVTELFLPKRIVSNRQHQVEITYNNALEKKWIYLHGPGGKEDSTWIEGNGIKSIRLSFYPRQSGNLLYSLIIKDSSGNSIKENIPMHVNDAVPLNILILQAYPTFETQYLKNFLSHKNHKLVLRYQLSKNNFRYEYANRTSIQMNRLTKSILNEFDVLIIDSDVLQKLSEAEKTSINESIQSGLGLLTLLNTSIKENNKPSDFFPFELRTTKSDTTTITLRSKAITIPALPVRAQATAGIQPVIKNNSGLLSGYKFAGAGKVAFQFLQETYRLSLSGDSLGYSSLWSPLLEQIARPHAESSSLKIVNHFPWYADEPLHVQVISSQQKPIIFSDSIQLPLHEDVLLDDLWQATLWADHPGWHLLQDDKGSTLPYYISNENEWKSLSVANQMSANTNSRTNASKSSPEKETQPKEVSPLYFYLIFILAAGFIWLAPKL